MELVAFERTPTPGLPNAQFDDLTWREPGPGVYLNDLGQTAFFAEIGNENSIWSEASGTLSLIARQDSTNPIVPSGVRLSRTPTISSSGKTAFIGGWVNDDDSSQTGIWTSDENGSLDLIAQTGMPVPGVPGETFFSLGTPSMNSTGQLLFNATLSDETGSGGGRGRASGQGSPLSLWGQSLNGKLRQILSEGDLVEVAPGDQRIVTGFDALLGIPSGNSDGQYSGINNIGQVALLVSFSDGTSAIVVSDLLSVPEPVNLALVLMGVTIFYGFGRNRQ